MKKIISILSIFIMMITFGYTQYAKAATVGSVLTGNYTYSDRENDPQGQSTFQWLRDGVAIPGATSLTYTVTTADQGHTLTFQVTPAALTGTSPGVPTVSSGIVIPAAGSTQTTTSSGGGMISVVIPASTGTPVITYASTATSTITVPTSTNTPSSNVISTTLNITRTLKLKSVGSDVKSLQVYLNTHGYVIAKKGAGSRGHETNLFGPATKAAVIKFQKANKITPISGIVGPLTLAKINQG